MTKSIVFGANGYIGRHICLELKNRNSNFLPISKSRISIDSYTNYKSIDVKDLKGLSSINLDVDYIYFFAGLTGTDTGKKASVKYKEVNEGGLINLLNEVVKQNSKAKVIFPSTRLIYKGVSDTYLKETDEKNCLTPYAKSKLNCELILDKYKKMHGVNFTVYRICVPYGNSFNNKYSYGTISFFLSKAEKSESIELFGDGKQKRTFTHINDISNIIIETSNCKESDFKTYNIGGPDNKSLVDVAKLIANNYNVEVKHIDWPEKALKIESGDTLFSDENIKADFNISYKNSLEAFFEIT